MSAARDDGRGYRETIAEMRDGLVARVGHFFRWRGPVLRDDKPRYAKLIRADIRRIRALDAVVERARDRDYMARVWMYIACGKTQLEAATLARAEMAAQEREP